MEASEVVWDPYHTGSRQLAALPYHPACAEGLLPPETPDAGMRRCGICEKELEEAELARAFEELRRRFQEAKGPAAPQEVVWRLAERAPRMFVPEHFACVLGKLGLG